MDEPVCLTISHFIPRERGLLPVGHDSQLSSSKHTKLQTLTPRSATVTGTQASTYLPPRLFGSGSENSVSSHASHLFERQRSQVDLMVRTGLSKKACSRTTRFCTLLPLKDAAEEVTAMSSSREVGREV